MPWPATTRSFAINSRRRLLALPMACLLTFPTALAAQAPAIPSQPEGWTLHAQSAGVILSSPPDASSNIVLLVIDKTVPHAPAGPAAKPASAIIATAEQFAGLTETSATRFGKLTWRQGVTLEETLLRDAVTLEDPDGNIIHGYAFAYATPGGLQTLSVFWPNPMTAASPPVAQALDHVAALWRLHYAYDGTNPDIAPLPPPAPPVTAENTPTAQ